MTDSSDGITAPFFTSSHNRMIPEYARPPVRRIRPPPASFVILFRPAPRDYAGDMTGDIDPTGGRWAPEVLKTARGDIPFETFINSLPDVSVVALMTALDTVLAARGIERPAPLVPVQA